MAKLNTARVRRTGASPIISEAAPSAVTHEGHPGYARDWRGELYLLAVANFVGEKAFYESTADRDARYRALVRHGAVEDPEWTGSLLGWVRAGVHLRSAAVVGAVEFAVARRDAGLSGHTRGVISRVLQRADEPCELVAYWLSHYGERPMPKPVKRGLGDAVRRLWSERATLKWDSPERGVRFADVLQLCRPAPVERHQELLFKHLLDRRYVAHREFRAELDVLCRHEELMALPVEQRRAVLDEPGAVRRVQQAGVTWEKLAGWAQVPWDADMWAKIIPSMGVMALVRNLRNFDAAGISGDTAALVAGRISDPEEIASSRMLPMQFLTAHRAAPSLLWSWPLEQALSASLVNVPELGGRTLIMVDTSSSMRSSFSKDGTLALWDAAVVFALALAARCDQPTVVSFSSSAFYMGEARRARTSPFPVQRGESVLRGAERWNSGGWFLGGGTETALALRERYDGHDRVVLLTDEQAATDGREISESVPADVPLHTFNLAGYRHGSAPSGTTPHRYTVGGLTDECFRMIPLVEAGQCGRWPWNSSELTG